MKISIKPIKSIKEDDLIISEEVYWNNTWQPRNTLTHKQQHPKNSDNNPYKKTSTRTTNTQLRTPIIMNNNNNARLEHRCANCDNPGHTARNCPWIHTMERSCNFCSQQGHITMHCPHRPQHILTYLQQHHNVAIICSFCLQTGHLYPNCPFYQTRMNTHNSSNHSEPNTTPHLGEFTESPEPMLCNNCGETGHSILQCPHTSNNTTSPSSDNRVIYQTELIQPTPGTTIPITFEQPDEHICTASCEASPLQLASAWNSPTHNNREVSPTPSNRSNVVYNSDTLTSILEAYGMDADLPNTYESSQPPEPSQSSNIILSPEPCITTHLTDTYPSRNSTDLLEDILHRFQTFLDEWDEDRLLEDWSAHYPTTSPEHETLTTLRQLSRHVTNSINDLLAFLYNNTEEPDPEDHDMWKLLIGKTPHNINKNGQNHATQHKKIIYKYFRSWGHDP